MRGEVIDLFPAHSELPVRIEITDGRVASLRAYDPISQRTQADLPMVEVGRAVEPPVGDGVPLLAHLRPARIVFDAAADARRKRFLALATEAARLGRGAAAAVPPALWQEALKDWQILDWSDPVGEPVSRFVRRQGAMGGVPARGTPRAGKRTRLVVAGGARDLRFLRPRLTKDLGCEPLSPASWAEVLALPAGSVAILPMPVRTGFRCADVLLVAAADLLGSRAARDDGGPAVPIDMLGDMTDLQIGDIVIHEDHGIARVAGIEGMPEGHGGSGGDAIVLEHAGEARRLIPVAGADRLWRYGADTEAVTLDKLDGSSWHKRRGAIQAAIGETARALSAMAEARASVVAPAFAPEPSRYERFVAGIRFYGNGGSGAGDRRGARRSCLGPPDGPAGDRRRRLRQDGGGAARGRAGRAGRRPGSDRGPHHGSGPPTSRNLPPPVRWHQADRRGALRLSSAAEKKAVKAGLADGSIHIVVGTGAVAAKDVAYNALGLIVIDEEQRFGATDKAKLRGDGSRHVLTLSATPIPRTLQTALIGLQQLSIIATPPARRQPIRTTLDAFDDAASASR